MVVIRIIPSLNCDVSIQKRFKELLIIMILSFWTRIKKGTVNRKQRTQ